MERLLSPAPARAKAAAGRSVVVVDDDRPWAEAVGELLREEGFAVQTAENGEQALQTLEAASPMIVILDVQLPRVGGFEVLRELRRSGFQSPVLMVSGDDRGPVIAQAMADGAAGFLRKPVAPALLLRAVRRLTAARS